jgi:hypothetical protein
MNRRTFAKYSALTVVGQAALPAFARNFHKTAAETPELLKWLIQRNDQSLLNRLEYQQQDTTHPRFGGVKDAYQIFTPQNTAYFIKTIVCSLVTPYSQYYKAEEFISPLENAADYLLKTQYADGTIDLLSTNFHSTPDTGFVVNDLAPVYSLMKRANWTELNGVQEKLQQFLRKAGEALSVGGIHTPNHRWVVSAALAWLHHLFPDQKYVTRIDQWLNEGIDIDPDGQFNEKSTYIYSAICDKMFIIMARLLNRPELLEPVRKNLEMTLYYIHPNGEVATEASGRQDQYQIGYMDRYYYPYRYMAIRDGNPKFAAVCKLIEKTSLPSLIQYLNYFLEDDSLWTNFPQPATLPTNYVREFPHSNLVRIRRDEVDATLIAGNATFFTMHKGEAVLQAVRLATAFFGKGQFSTETIEREGNQYTFRQQLEGPYYQLYPVEELPGDGNWEKMPKSNRPQSEVQKLESIVVITEENGKFKMEIDIKGTENVPVTVELAFRHGGTLSNVGTVENIPDAFVLSSGHGQYQMGNEVITFGPGQVEHTWTQLRGALPKMEAQSVYLTGFTPYHQVLEFK